MLCGQVGKMLSSHVASGRSICIVFSLLQTRCVYFHFHKYDMLRETRHQWSITKTINGVSARLFALVVTILVHILFRINYFKRQITHIYVCIYEMYIVHVIPNLFSSRHESDGCASVLRHWTSAKIYNHHLMWLPKRNLCTTNTHTRARCTQEIQQVFIRR